MSQHSDVALTELASEWDTLTPATRRVLLKEMQRRMSRQRQGRSGAPAGESLLQIRSERRFGRRVRQSDGSLVTIETRVVRLRTRPQPSPEPLPGQASNGAGEQVASGPFGVGFERRSAQRRIILVPRRPTPVLPVADAQEASDSTPAQ